LNRLRYHREIFTGARYGQKSSDEFEDGFIPMHCGVRLMMQHLWCYKPSLEINIALQSRK